MAEEPEPEPEPAPNTAPAPALASLRRQLVALNGTACVSKTTSTSLSLADDAALARFLAAKHQDVELACAAIRETLGWRAAFGVDSLSQDCWPTIQRESADAKVYWSGRDHAGRPIIYMRAAAET
jgi:hypothetical protein